MTSIKFVKSFYDIRKHIESAVKKFKDEVKKKNIHQKNLAIKFYLSFLLFNLPLLKSTSTNDPKVSPILSNSTPVAPS